MPVKLRYFLSGECSSFSPALTPISVNRAIPASDYQYVVVTIIDDCLYELQLVFVNCRKRFHARWNAIHFH